MQNLSVFPIDQKLYARSATVVRQTVHRMAFMNVDFFDLVEYTDNTDIAPSTGKAIHAAFSAAVTGGEKVKILKTPVDCKCFLGPAGNDVYRAFHDFDHYQAFMSGNGETTRLSDEVTLNVFMVDKIMAMLDIEDQDVKDTAHALLFADLVGQAVYYAKHKDFISNHGQEEFCKWLGGYILAGILQGIDPLQTIEQVKVWPKF